MWKIEDAFLKHVSNPDYLGMKYAEGGIFYYRFNDTKIDIGVKSSFDRWSNSTDFTCFCPSNKRELSAILLMVFAGWVLGSWRKAGYRVALMNTNDISDKVRAYLVSNKEATSVFDRIRLIWNKFSESFIRVYITGIILSLLIWIFFIFLIWNIDSAD